MKYLSFLLIVFPLIVWGQKDLCSSLVKEGRDSEGVVTYRSPLIGKTNILSAARTIDDTVSTFTIYIGILSDHPVTGAKGTALKLEDGTFFKNPDAPVTSKMVDTDQYNLSGSLSIEEQDIEALTTSRIITVTCAGIEHKLTADDALKFIAYMKCLLDRQ